MPKRTLLDYLVSLYFVSKFPDIVLSVCCVFVADLLLSAGDSFTHITIKNFLIHFQTTENFRLDYFTFGAHILQEEGGWQKINVKFLMIILCHSYINLLVLTFLEVFTVFVFSRNNCFIHLEDKNVFFQSIFGGWLGHTKLICCIAHSTLAQQRRGEGNEIKTTKY